MVSTLHEPPALEVVNLFPGGCADRAIDIVAVHGLCETSATAWVEPKNQQSWLEQWLPDDLQVARILTFDYDSSARSFFEEDGDEKVGRIAQTLVQNIETHRSLERGGRRPIIFICHGLGGVIVKKALIYASSQTSPHVQHLYTVYVSTFALLFFGVPHHSLSRGVWLDLEEMLAGQLLASGENSGSRPILCRLETEALHSINGGFAPLTRQFRIFLFWEEIKTKFPTSQCFVVEPASAAPEMPNTERMGIFSDHVNMIKFQDRTSSPYRPVRAAIERYCREAPSIIARRWELAEQHINLARVNEAYELTGVVYRLEDHPRRLSVSPYARQPGKERVQLPRRPDRDFVGREDMANKLYSAFWREDAAAQKIYVLYGMGGAGKTEISIRFAKENQLRYSAVFTIDATDSDKIKTSFANIGKYGDLEATEKSGKYWLEQLDDSWLLIIDNADDPDLDLVSLFPDCDHGHILVTTRNPEFRRYNTAGCSLVGELKEKEALHLLFLSAQISGPPWEPTEEAAASKIVKALGFLALALKAAGTSIYRKICQLHDYLDYHRHYCNQYQVQTKETRTLTDDEARTYAVFDISSKWLEFDLSPENRDAAQLLDIVAFFHFEHIPVDAFIRAAKPGQLESQSDEHQPLFESLLQAFSHRLKPPRARPSFLKHKPRSELRYRINKTLRRLNSLSIIFYDEGGTTFSLHPLVHAWTRDRLRQGERKLRARVALNVLMDSIELPESSSGDENISYHRQILPHLNSCMGACTLSIDDYTSIGFKLRVMLAPILQPSLIAILGENILDLAKCGYIYLSCGYFEKSIKYLSDVGSALLHISGPQNEKTMKAQLGLARAYWGLGRLESAIDIQQSVVSARTIKYGPTHCETLLAMDHLARSYWLNGQYKEALELQDRTVLQMQQRLAESDHRLLEALDNLGVIYGSWHRFEDSLAVHRRVLSARLENADSAPQEVIGTKMYLAMAMLGTKNVVEAQNNMTEVYNARKRHLGKEHPWTLWALCYLAKIKVKVQQLDDAESMLKEGIAAGQRSLSDDHLGVLMGRGELARVYSRQGRLQEASDLLEDTIMRLGRSRGQEHPDHVYAIWKLVQLRIKQGGLSDAAHQCRRSLSLAEGRLTLKHPLACFIKTELDAFDGKQSESRGT